MPLLATTYAMDFALAHAKDSWSFQVIVPVIPVVVKGYIPSAVLSVAVFMYRIYSNRFWTFKVGAY